MAKRTYYNEDHGVQLTEQEYRWFHMAREAFDRAYQEDQAYIDYPLGAVIFTPDALREHGKYYPAAERLRLSNPDGYEYLMFVLRKYERRLR